MVRRPGRSAQAGPLGDQVSFVGFASPEQLPERYRSFDVVIVPSRSRARMDRAVLPGSRPSDDIWGAGDRE
jgi:glycosyltransferase involved in cell wall biosynthesis